MNAARSRTGHRLVPLADLLEVLRDCGDPDHDGVTILDLLDVMAQLGCGHSSAMYLIQLRQSGEPERGAR